MNFCRTGDQLENQSTVNLGAQADSLPNQFALSSSGRPILFAVIFLYPERIACRTSGCNLASTHRIATPIASTPLC
jgi:hypothetical protein